MQNEKDLRWLRRGHNHKPNVIVRCCYAIADWLGDFGPMLSTAKQGAINTGLIVANFVILLGILITSAVHSLELLRYSGANGGLEYVMLLVWESVFLVSSFLLDQALKRGMGSLKQSWQVWIPFLLGLAFVFSSNFIGMAGNIAGMLIGGITPFLLLFIKWMLGWQLHNRAKFDAEQKREKMKQAIEKTNELSFMIAPEKPEKSPTKKTENPVEKSAENEEKKTAKKIGETAENTTIKNAGDETATNPEMPSDSEDKNLEKTEQKRNEKIAEKVDGELTKKTPTKTDEKSEKNTSKNSAKTTKKKTTKRRRTTRKNPEKMIEKAVEIIKKELEETGEFPTHKEVAVLAKTSEYYAKKARSIVKEERKAS